MSNNSENRVKALLEKDGYYCEAEPEWAKSTGRKVPDFFCSGSSEFWVEVKSIEESDEQRALFEQHERLVKAARRVNAYGQAFGWVSSEADDRAIRDALRLAARLLNSQQNSADRMLSIVPRDPMRGRYVEITATKQNRTLRVAAPVSKSGTYGLKYSEEFIADVTAKLNYSDGSEINQPAFKVFDVENAVMVLEVEDGPDPLRIVGVSGDAWRSPFVERVRASASTANSQFKAAIKSRAAPTLLVIDDSQSMVSDIRQFQAAFYGDLAIRWNLTTNETDALHHAGNRLWQQGKNTTTSAACYVRQDAPPVILHNIWADCPLPWATLSAYELFPRSDGRWQEVDSRRQHQP